MSYIRPAIAVMAAALLLSTAWALAEQKGQDDKRSMLQQQMARDLRLDEKTAARLAEAFESMRPAQMELMKSESEQVDKLRQELMKTTPDKKTLKGLLDMLEEGEKKREALRQKETASIKEILDVEQQARFAVYKFSMKHRQGRGPRAPQGAGGQGMRPEGQAGQRPSPGQRAMPPR